MTQTPTTITTSGGLLTAAFIDAVREPETFAAPGSAPRTPADVVDAIVEISTARCWKCCTVRYDAEHDHQNEKLFAGNQAYRFRV